MGVSAVSPETIPGRNGGTLTPFQGCVRSPGTDVSPSKSGGARVSASLASPAI